MSDRSNKPSFAVSRNLKHAKYHFIEAITDKLTESSNTTPNSVSTSTWLCVTSNMISTSHKTWQTSLLFLELLQIQNLKRKSGGNIAYYVPPTWKSGGARPPCPPPNCARACNYYYERAVWIGWGLQCSMQLTAGRFRHQWHLSSVAAPQIGVDRRVPDSMM